MISRSRRHRSRRSRRAPAARLLTGKNGQLVCRPCRQRSGRQFLYHPSTQIVFLTMAILVTPETSVVVQGITGSFGARHAQLSLDYGTHIVAAV